MTVELQIAELQKENGELKRRAAKLERTVAFLLNELKLTYVDTPDNGPYQDVTALVLAGNRLGAIKLYREKTGASLEAAQTFIASI